MDRRGVVILRGKQAQHILDVHDTRRIIECLAKYGQPRMLCLSKDRNQIVEIVQNIEVDARPIARFLLVCEGLQRKSLIYIPALSGRDCVGA